MRCHIYGSTTTQISEINNFVCTCWNVYNGQLENLWTPGNKWKDLSQWMIQRTVIKHMKWFRVGSTGDLLIALYWQFSDVVTRHLSNPHHYLNTCQAVSQSTEHSDIPVYLSSLEVTTIRVSLDHFYVQSVRSVMFFFAFIDVY